jgi:hypothetical protein
MWRAGHRLSMGAGSILLSMAGEHEMSNSYHTALLLGKSGFQPHFTMHAAVRGQI